MSVKTTGLVAIAAILATPVFADGGPVPEPVPEPAPMPEPAPEPMPEPAPEPAGGFYVSGAGGAVWLPDFEVEGLGGPFTIDTDTGWAALGAVGYDYGNNWRTELEVGYRSNDGLQFDFFEGIPAADADVSVNALDIMVNALYELNTDSFLDPYVGVGVGAARIDVDVDWFRGPPDQDDGWAFAYQVIGGVNVPLSGKVDLFVDYRYLATAGLSLDFGGDVVDHDEYRSNTVVGGLRVTF